MPCCHVKHLAAGVIVVDLLYAHLSFIRSCVQFLAVFLVWFGLLGEWLKLSLPDSVSRRPGECHHTSGRPGVTNKGILAIFTTQFREVWGVVSFSPWGHVNSEEDLSKRT